MANKHEFAKALKFVLIIQAAMDDATHEQHLELRNRIQPRLEQFRKDGIVKPVIDEIFAVLGQDWLPTGPWAAYLFKLHLAEYPGPKGKRG